jgi:shikimate kinase
MQPRHLLRLASPGVVVKGAVNNTRRDRIFLTGFMGSGKTTIGPILANTLGWSFADLDRSVEVLAGRTINEIFRGMGESAFREMERTVLHEVGATRHLVIALGGGTIAEEQNFRYISQSGILVYLHTPPDQLVLRLRRKTNRPLLGGGGMARLDEQELRSKVAELHGIREPYYRMADVIVETANQPVGVTVDEIVKRIVPLIS